jgi:hypothetical protein
MSIRVMTQVWATSQHKGSRLLLLLAIADFAHDDGTGAYPSIATLAEKIRMSERQVIRLLQALEASGELMVKPGGSRYATNLLTIPVRGDKLAPLRGDRKAIRGDKKRRGGVTQLRHPNRPPYVSRSVRSREQDATKDEVRAVLDGLGKTLKRIPS